MKSLRNFSDLELELELEKRKERREKEPVPLAFAAVDFHNLYQLILDSVERMKTGDMDSEDEHWIYETAIETIYDKEFWNWRNEREANG